MTTNARAASELELRPLEDDQLEMAHAVDAIDQALSKAGLTWPQLAEIIAGAAETSMTRRVAEHFSPRRCPNVSSVDCLRLRDEQSSPTMPKLCAKPDSGQNRFAGSAP